MRKLFKVQSLSQDIIPNAERYWGTKSGDSEFFVPSFAGEGYIKVFICSQFIKMVVIQLSLLEELNFVKDVGDKEIISFAFRNMAGTKEFQETPFGKLFPAIQVTSSDIELSFLFPAGKKIHTIIIEIHRSVLKEYLQSKVDCFPFLKIIESQKSYLFEEIGSLEIVQSAQQIFKSKIDTCLSSFYSRLKAEELIYLFFVELLKRKGENLYSINKQDLEKMNTVKDLIFNDLSYPPPSRSDSN